MRPDDGTDPAGTRAGEEPERRREAAEQERQVAEELRRSGEELRRGHEQLREECEEGRQVREEARQEAEDARRAEESLRVAAEEARRLAEELRRVADEARQAAEEQRAILAEMRETARLIERTNRPRSEPERGADGASDEAGEDARPSGLAPAARQLQARLGDDRPLAHRTHGGVSRPLARGGTQMQKATIRVPALKVAVPLAADALSQDLVPPDGPAGEPVIELALGDGPTVAVARLNGKNFRRMLKAVAEHGAGNVVVVLQGALRPPHEPGGPFVLTDAGFQVNVKTPKPDGQAPQ